MTEFKKGDIVKIFEHPMSQENFEGNARLIKKIRPKDQAGMERWKVSFLDDEGCIDDHFERWVKAKQ